MSSYLYDRSIRGMRLLTPPTVEPISLELAKQHLRLEPAFTDDDAYIQLLIVGARQWAEGYTRRALCNQQWLMTLDRFPTWGDTDDPYFWLYRRGIVDVIKPPLRSIDQLQYIDTTGATQTLTAGTDFIVDIQDAYGRIEPIYGSFWPITQFRIAVATVTQTSGYTNIAGDPQNAIPVPIKLGILLLIGGLYENREHISALPNHPSAFGAEDLMSQYRAIRFGP